MKALHLPSSPLSNVSKQASEMLHRLPKLSLSTSKAQKYLSDALNEGLKQNLLGSEINMEFLILSVRSYSGLLFNMLGVGKHAKNN